ncbi:hypothetical protein HPB47_027528 [Ixodes persulcatus]|uniref:Uncharacterized protein n=1 Tax=Ixodes persulcatus TaxID=34615 RepID=A0AC60PW65_IXOPE|nr:hypothetical protein HPB47_027528 [Ixodes persulcatus]
MAYRRAFTHNVQPYSVPQSSPNPIPYRRPGDRSGFGFSAEPAPGPQPRDEEDRDRTVSTSQAIAASPTRASPYRAPTPQHSQLRNPRPAVAAAEVVAAPAASCASCGRGCRDVRHACTWTVQVGEVPISYVSHDEWRQQARPERGAAPETVPEPFRGCTLSDRHPREPKAGYSDAERERLCPVCGTLVLHWETHLAGGLHRSRAPPERAQPVPSHMDVVAALQVLQAGEARPDRGAAGGGLARGPAGRCKGHGAGGRAAAGTAAAEPLGARAPESVDRSAHLSTCRNPSAGAAADVEASHFGSTVYGSYSSRELGRHNNGDPHVHLAA